MVRNDQTHSSSQCSSASGLHIFAGKSINTLLYRGKDKNTIVISMEMESGKCFFWAKIKWCPFWKQQACAIALKINMLLTVGLCVCCLTWAWTCWSSSRTYQWPSEDGPSKQRRSEQEETFYRRGPGPPLQSASPWWDTTLWANSHPVYANTCMKIHYITT